MNIFNVQIEFDKIQFEERIQQCIRSYSKGYVCVIDANVLTMAQKDITYRKIINSSYVNTCDGSSIAGLANLIYKTSYRAYNGPEIFENYIEKPICQLLLGNTQEKANEIKSVLREKNMDDSYLQFMPLPFLAVNDFDYPKIASQINALKPDIIWVSLGAPKQEIFMSEIFPYLDKGLLFGIGAAFNFYTGELSCPKASLGSFRFIWLDRLVKEPKKIGHRIFNYIKILPSLYISELKRSKLKK